MARNIDDIDYTRLSTAERLLLMQDILESVMDEVHTHPLSTEQLAELDRRYEAVQSGREPLHPWEEVQADLRTNR